jgi:hypothetical protein
MPAAISSNFAHIGLLVGAASVMASSSEESREDRKSGRHLRHSVRASRILNAIPAVAGGKKTEKSPLGEREPGVNPGQACCCNGPRGPDKQATAQAGRRRGGRSQKTGRAGGIVLTYQEPMQPAAP